MRRGFHRGRTSRGGSCGGLPLENFDERTKMTADKFEGLDERQAEAWIAERFRAFALNGLSPELSLICAVHPEVDAPGAIVTTASSTPPRSRFT
jgi:hypothetical protein